MSEGCKNANENIKIIIRQLINYSFSDLLSNIKRKKLPKWFARCELKKCLDLKKK